MPEVHASSGSFAPGVPLRVECITTVDEWRGISSDWDRVLRATHGYTGLQSFDFLSTWWECFSAGRSLWILAFYRDTQLVGVAPLQIVERRILGKTYRILQFLAMTEDILRPTVLFSEEYRPALFAELSRALVERRQNWDLLELDELVCTDLLIDTMKRLADLGGYLYRKVPFHPCPYLDLSSQTFDNYWRGRSRKLRKNVQAGERKLAQIGTVGLEVYRTPDDIGVGFGKFLGLARLSWKHDAKIGIADDERYETFYARLLETFARRHGACILILSVAGRPIAGTIAVLFDEVYHSLQIVHDESYARYSPGTLLEARELELLLSGDDARRYEFMGGALRNKLRWTDDLFESVCIRLVRSDIRLRAVEIFESSKPVAKRMLKRARSAVSALRASKIS